MLYALDEDVKNTTSTDLPQPRHHTMIAISCKKALSSAHSTASAIGAILSLQVGINSQYDVEIE